MFECDYKFQLEDALICTKYVYKSQRKKKDKIIEIAIPVLMICMVAMLIADVINNKSIVWDVILLVALVALEVMYLMMPVMMANSQKKIFKKQKLDEIDQMKIKIENGIVTIAMMKDGDEVAKNSLSLKRLSSYIEDSKRLVLVFNEIEYVCLRKANLTGDINRLKQDLTKYMSGEKKNKK